MRADMIPVVQLPTGEYTPDFLRATYRNIASQLVTERQVRLSSALIPYPELVSARLYGDTQYWWVLCMFNNIIDPFTDMRVGMTLNVPTLRSITSALSRARSSSGTKIGTVVSL